MKLLVVSQYFWPENFRVNDLVMELQRRGHDVTVLTALPNYPEGVVHPDYQAAPDRFDMYEGATVVRVPFLPRGKGPVRLAMNYLSFVVATATIGTWKLRGRRFDAVFVFQPSPITACLPAVWIGKLKRAPVVLWVLDLWPETLAAIGVVRSPALLSAVGRLVSYVYRNCALVLGQSRSFEPNITRYSGDKLRFRYFPGWAESPLQQPLSQVDPAPELTEFRDTFNIVFAGNIGDAQDFPAILNAADQLREHPNLRWLIVGDGRAAEWVRSEIKRRNLERAVRLLGRHPLERMPEFFRGADALLVTLKRDPVFALTIPGKVQTYLATGVPLIGMLDGEGARVIEESGAGLVAPSGDSRELARLVIRLQLMSKGERAAMGARGIAYSRQEFDRACLVTALETWLREVSGKHHTLATAAR